jgi:peroxiredoxin
MILKKITLFAAGLVFVAGCAKEAKFTINGKLSGSIKDSLFLEEMTDKALEPRTTLITGDDGSFSYTDTASNPRLIFLRTTQKEYMMLMVLGGDNITLTAEKNRITPTLAITGSKQSELLLELNRELMRATGLLDSLGEQYQGLLGKGNDPQAESWIQGHFGKLMEEQQAFIRRFIGQNYAEPASLMALSHQFGQQPVLNARNDFDLFEKVDVSLFKKYPNSNLVQNLHKFVTAMKPQISAMEEQSKTTGKGALAPDITLNDPAGNPQTLSSLRGKIVLLDFWAAWCGPCRRENPNLVSAYAKYHDKGFEIYQVSLDKTKPEWEAAIKQDGLNWIHVSDLKYWSSPIARKYGVESIPANFLLDKEGRIIATNLRGAALEEELAKHFR